MQVAINGMLSEPFKITRGIQQGDLLSCPIFDLGIKPCCCSLCCVRASLQSPCGVLWSCVLHSTSSVIVSRVMGLCVVSPTVFCVLSSLSIVLLCIYTAVDWELSPQSHSLHCRFVASLFCP